MITSAPFVSVTWKTNVSYRHVDTGSITIASYHGLKNRTARAHSAAHQFKNHIQRRKHYSILDGILPPKKYVRYSTHNRRVWNSVKKNSSRLFYGGGGLNIPNVFMPTCPKRPTMLDNSRHDTRKAIRIKEDAYYAKRKVGTEEVNSPNSGSAENTGNSPKISPLNHTI